jgi:arginyl-tRNA synthetase
MYPRASKRCKEDESAMAEAVAATDALQKGRKGYLALWNHFVALSMQTLRNDFDSLGVSFDHWLGESFYQKQMERLVERLRSDGTAQVSEGALVIHVAEQGDAVEVPPVMLVKSGGGFLYSTSDMATIEYRVNHFNADTILYVVDQRQSLHFQQVFRAVRRTGIAGPRIVLEHVGFGTVNGTDGKPFKTRSGGVMKLSDLIEQVTVKADERMREAGIAQDLDPQEHRNTARMVGIAALKFADLLNHRLSNYVFDIDKFTRFEGKTGPYLLYSAVRIKSILRKAAEQGVHAGSLRAPSGEERRLMLLLCAVQDTIAEAVASYAPNYLCDFAYNLAQEFNRFYKDCHILREEDKQKQGSWLSLAQLCLKEFEVLLGLLGIEIPDRM